MKTWSVTQNGDTINIKAEKWTADNGGLKFIIDDCIIAWFTSIDRFVLVLPENAEKDGADNE